MTQEDKELLFKDLCARLPYNVICQVEFRESGKYQSKSMFLSGVFTDEAYFTTESGSIYSNEYKPYLFPLSSMTERQCYELASIRSDFQDCWKYIKTPIPLSICNFEQIDWFHKNHLDYRGLVEKGLAIDATGLNIY